MRLVDVGDSAGVAFDRDGNLLAVAGTEVIFRVSREDGSLEETDLSTDPDCAGAALVSVLAGKRTTWLGAADGRVLALDEELDCNAITDLGDQPVTGLALVPKRFELGKGALVAAAGSDGVFSIDVTEDGAPPVERITPDSTDAYVDLDFFGDLLVVLDASNGAVATLSLPEGGGEGTLDVLDDGLAGGVGLAIDPDTSQLVVADAGAGLLRSLVLVDPDPQLSDLAPYPFDAAPPGGVAFDGSGTLALATAGSVVLRAARVPPLAPGDFGTLLAGPNRGYGDMELDDEGNLLLVANRVAEGDLVPAGNFLLRVRHDGRKVTDLESDVGSAGERLLALARDAFGGDLYIGSELEVDASVDPDGQVGHIFRRDARGDVSTLADLDDPVLGLAWAPELSEFSGQLVATTQAGAVVAVDPATGAQTPVDDLGTALPDLVFGSDGTLYVLANAPSAIWVRPDGGSFSALASGSSLGLPDGLALDEGGARLLVASEISADTDQLLEVTLGGSVRALVDIDIDDGFFPTGVVYDGLSRVAVRASDGGTAIDVFSVPLPL